MSGLPVSLSMNLISRVAFNASAIFSKSIFENLLLAYLLHKFCGVISERLANSLADISFRSTQHSFIYFVTFILSNIHLYFIVVKIKDKKYKNILQKGFTKFKNNV